MKADILIAGVMGRVRRHPAHSAAAILEGYAVRTGKPLACLSGAVGGQPYPNRRSKQIGHHSSVRPI